jgi:hypothetical protein
MDYYYGWGFYLWPLFFFALFWGIFAWRADRWDYRGRGRYYGPRYDWEAGYGTSYRWRREKDFKGRGPRGYQRADERIADDVNDRLLVSSEVDATDISVSVNQGEVVLSGRVSGREEKRVAEWLADSVAGVVDVKNELKVGASSGSKAA